MSSSREAAPLGNAPTTLVSNALRSTERLLAAMSSTARKHLRGEWKMNALLKRLL